MKLDLVYNRDMKRILSGITPSGEGSLHIGNYLGAVRQFIDLARENECFLMVADMHALTTVQDKKNLQRNVETLVLNELALLGDLSNIVFFRQSDVPMHTELQSILNNITPLGLLKRAHAYKDKLAKDVMEGDINLGLFNYPILMAADILMYKPDLVPVGRDQKQHIEITRDIAGQFNKAYKKDVFKLPEPYIPDEVAVILGTDGQRKMSKSLGNIIGIFEDEATILKQVMGVYTDPTRAHATDPGHIEGNMVFAYLDFFGEVGVVEELKKRYRAGKVSDVEVKEYLFESLMKTFANARVRYQKLKDNPKEVKEILEEGASKARAVSISTMSEVRDVIGITNQYSFFSYPKQGKSNFISIDEFAKVEMRVGLVTEAVAQPGSEKLNKLTVDFGTETRTIFTGVRKWYAPEYFLNKKFVFVFNLESKKIMGEESQGMIMAIDGFDGRPVFVIAAEDVEVGAKVR